MSNIKQLFAETENWNLHCCICRQKITDYSVEIYKGYKSSYVEVFYTDGHSEMKDAVKKALKFMKTYKPKT